MAISLMVDPFNSKLTLFGMLKPCSVLLGSKSLINCFRYFRLNRLFSTDILIIDTYTYNKCRRVIPLILKVSLLRYRVILMIWALLLFLRSYLKKEKSNNSLGGNYVYFMIITVVYKKLFIFFILSRVLTINKSNSLVYHCFWSVVMIAMITALMKRG